MTDPHGLDALERALFSAGRTEAPDRALSERTFTVLRGALAELPRESRPRQKRERRLSFGIAALAVAAAASFALLIGREPASVVRAERRSPVSSEARDLRPLAPEAAPAGSARTAACTPVACAPVTPGDALLTDFHDVGPGPVFVDNDRYSAPNPEWWLGFYGSVYAYPLMTAGSSASGLRVEVADQYRVRGRVSAWAGFGLWLSCVADFSAYRGISFILRGDAGPTQSVRLVVGTTANVAHDVCKPSLGTCRPDSGPCVASSKRIPISRAAAPNTVLWTDLTGGRPLASPDSSRIAQINWSFDWTDASSAGGPTPYAVDVTLDEVRLIP